MYYNTVTNQWMGVDRGEDRQLLCADVDAAHGTCITGSSDGGGDDFTGSSPCVSDVVNHQI